MSAKPTKSVLPSIYGGRGWVPDVPDQRDFVFSAPRAVLKALPLSVDLSRSCPPVWDQGNLGSCTAQAVAALFDTVRKRQKAPFIDPSRLFIYFNERVLEDTVAVDAGAMLRSGIKTVVKQGAATERAWPYIIRKFKTKPPKAAYTEAEKYQALSYLRINNRYLSQMKGCLAEGFPFVFGSMLYASFYDAAGTGIVPMPKSNEEAVGGHAMLAVGYSDTRKAFLVRNSWGTSWGKSGYHWMPYEYLANTALSDDFWTIRRVE